MNRKPLPEPEMTALIASLRQPPGGLVDPAFDGDEWVDTSLPDGEVPMDRVHAATLADEHELRLRIVDEKLRGLPPRRDPYMLDILMGIRDGDLGQARVRAISNSANKQDLMRRMAREVDQALFQRPTPPSRWQRLKDAWCRAWINTFPALSKPRYYR